MASEFVKITDGTDKVCLADGLTIINGGGAIADMTLSAPFPGCRAVIRCGAAAGNIVVTVATGCTLNGTNTIATFDAANEMLALVYDGAKTWAIEANVGAVALS